MDISEKIVNEKIPCYFISPHLDDAILSAGGLIDYLANKTGVEIITVFTGASPKPYTRFCQKFMSDCGYSDVDLFFQDRRIEDKIVCKKVNADYRHLGFIDVAWRKKQNPNPIEKLLGRLLPEFLYLYPLGRNFMSGKVVKDDGDLIKAIKNKLSSVILNSFQDLKRHSGEDSDVTSEDDSRIVVRNNDPAKDGMTTSDYFIFCPLAIGNHVDHVIIRNICAEIFPLDKLIFWTDYPYISWGNTAEDFIEKLKLQSFTWDKNLENKRRLILDYKTQIPALFPKGLTTIPTEVFYSKA